MIVAIPSRAHATGRTYSALFLSLKLSGCYNRPYSSDTGGAGFFFFFLLQTITTFTVKGVLCINYLDTVATFDYHITVLAGRQPYSANSKAEGRHNKNIPFERDVFVVNPPSDHPLLEIQFLSPGTDLLPKPE